jgi:hypothetical protein
MWTEEKQRRFDTLRRDDAAPLTPDEQQELAALFDELDREEWEQLRPALAAYEQKRQALGEELLQLEAEGVALAELARRYEDWLLRARQLVARLLNEREELRAERERVTR